MSRIYDALQRADLDRKAAQETGQVAAPVLVPEAAQQIQQEISQDLVEVPVASPTATPVAEDLPQAVATVDLGTIVPTATWTLVVEDLPKAKVPVDMDSIARNPWKLAISSFPTLLDRGVGVEQFRSLRTRIFQCRYDAPLKTILVSSGMPGEGKTFVTVNLALSLARNSVNKVNNILLIDGDLRRPTLHHLLGAPNEPGLSEYLDGTAQLHQIMQRASNPEVVESNGLRSISNMTFISAGKCGDNASDVVANHRIHELIATLAPHFDWILIDSPPVLAVTDAVELARAADGVLLVARGAVTPFDVAKRAQTAFNASRMLGFVLNDVKDAPHGEGSYYYYGGAEANHGDKPRKDNRI